MFDDPSGYLWLIPFLPLLASAVTALIGPRWLGRHSHWPGVLAAVASCVLSLLVFLAVSRGFEGSTLYYTWFRAGDVDIGFSLRADALTAIMLVTVTFVGSLIAIYSVGYMHGDAGYARYFAAVSLFLFSMTGLVMADNFILLYAFWEGVGLCSYLLIGHWFTKPSAAAAARKAFLVTRIGDVGLFLGILLLWNNVRAPGGTTHVLDYDAVFASAGALTGWLGVGICLLLFCGAVGKSAQFPLHVWLPDAMEGPTPVSALIHAATMVTAGVYLVARCMPLFALNEIALMTVACIGGLTALLAAIMALTQTDLKRVLAYSTISQLGYMFLGLGAGIRGLAEFAVVASIFHLFTHAFFKALLFLGSGSVMHAMGNVSDMRRFGGLRHVLKTTHWTFLCGAAALAGVPLISGFWSKDDIISVTLHASSGFDVYGLLFALALVTAGLTAFYTFRAYFMTFWGEVRIPQEAGQHVQESPTVMLLPLQILAVGALVVGVVFGPTHLFHDFLHERWMKTTFAPFLQTDDGAHLNFAVMAASGVIALAGIGMAYWMYVRRPEQAAEVAGRLPVMYELSRNRFYLDEIYDAFIVQPLSGLARTLRVLDQYIVDGLVDLVGQLPRLLGVLLRPVQNGLVQVYALIVALGVAGFLLAVLLR